MLESRLSGVINPKFAHIPLFTPPQTTDSVTSPSQLFRIHFTRTGESSVTDEYVQFVAEEAESAFRFQCDTLGFPTPASSFGHDSLWHIYIENLPDRIYGYTAYSEGGELGMTPAGFMKLRSFIVIDNDFLTTPTKGLDAARITIEHEFFHVIEFACYGALRPSGDGYTIDDINFVEMSSVWIEMLSTPWVPDFLFWLEPYFANIDQVVDKVPNQGYSQGIWPKFIEQRFGHGVMQEAWLQYGESSADPLKAFEHAIGLHSSTFCQEYKKFGAELVETGRRSRGKSSLPNADKYPIDKLKVHRVDPGVPKDVSGADPAHPASLNIVAAGFGEDTTFVVISRNTEFFDANATVTITAKNTFTASYSSPSMFCDTLIEFDALKTEAFPVPLIVSDQDISQTFRVKTTTTGLPPVSPPRLTIYTASMKLVRFSDVQASPFGGSWYASWDGRDDTGALVSSGMYIYVLEVDGKTSVGKFPVVAK